MNPRESTDITSFNDDTESTRFTGHSSSQDVPLDVLGPARRAQMKTQEYHHTGSSKTPLSMVGPLLAETRTEHGAKYGVVTTAETCEESPIEDDHEARSQVVIEDEEGSAWSTIAPYIAVGVLVAVVIFMIVIIPCNIWLNGDFGTFTNADREMYSTGLAVIASLLSAFVNGQIRRLWFTHLVKDRNLSAGEELTKRVRVLLQIDSIWSLWRMPYAWSIVILTLIAGLNISAIVGAASASEAPRLHHRSSFLFRGVDLVTGINQCWFTETTPFPDKGMQWYNSTTQNFTVSNPTPYAGPWDVGYCPQNLFYTVNSLRPMTGYFPGRAQEGGYPNYTSCLAPGTGHIQCSALGSPMASDQYCGLMAGFGCEAYSPWGPVGTTFNNWTACVPVFTKNPVSCSIAGVITTDPANDTLIDSVATESCVVTRNDTGWPAMVSSMEPSSDFVGVCTHNDTLGDATFLIASVHDGYALELLRGAMMQFDNYVYASDTPPLAVECTISLSDAVAWQTVYYQQNVKLSSQPQTNQGGLFHAEDFGASSGPGNVVSGTGMACDPRTKDDDLATDLSNVVDFKTRATAAVMLFSHLSQALTDALPDPTYGSYQYWNETPNLAFADSFNGLEDWLGVAVAGYTASYWGYLGATPFNATPNGAVTYATSFTSPSWRVGRRRWTSVLYILPPLSTIGILLWLLKVKSVGARQAEKSDKSV